MSKRHLDADHDPVPSEKADLSIIRLHAEYDPIKCNSQRCAELDKLVVQIFLASRKRGRPRTKERSDDE
jgi:hypothetical protein